MDLMSYALNRIARNHAQQAILQQATLQSSTQQSTVPPSQVTQQAQQKKKRNKKTRQQYKRRALQQTQSLEQEQQVIAKDFTESISDSPDNTYLFTPKHASLLLRQVMISAFQYTFSMLTLSPNYIRFAKEIEATGQG